MLFNSQLTDFTKTEKLSIAATLLIYFILAAIWAVQGDYTWDDDAPTRIYNTLNAFSDPVHFISLWNRPLFVVLFALPLKISMHLIPVLMPLFMAGSGFLAVLGLRKLKVPGAIFALPFLLFQPYLFLLSYQAYTEPLAAVLINLSVYLFANKKWWGLAIAGGLIPLARLELAPLLIFWIIPLIKNKQWKAMLSMGVPLVIWNIGGWLVTDQVFYLLDQTIWKESGSNRYGHNDWDVYIGRYFLVLGPIVFVPFLAGLFYSISRKRLLPIALIFCTGFFIYTLFSWKLDLGNAAGFLRNITTLSPLAAILAGIGLHQIITFLSRPKEDAEKEKLWLKVLVIAAIPLSVFLAWKFYSFKVGNHHTILKVVDQSNLYWTIGSILLVLAILILKKHFSHLIAPTVLGLSIGLCVAFIGMEEPPNTSYSQEREAMAKVASFQRSTELLNETTYANHIWYYWSQKLDKHDSTKYKTITQENLLAAEDGSVIVWENHYSSRLAGDVKPPFFSAHRKEFIELGRFYSPDRQLLSFVLQKKPEIEHAQTIGDFYTKHSEEPGVKYAYAKFLHEHSSQPKKAIELCLEVLEADTNIVDCYNTIGMCYYSLKNYEEAIKYLKKLEKRVKKNDQLYFNIGSAAYYAQDYDLCITYMNKAIAKNPKRPNAHFMKSLSFMRQEKSKESKDELVKELKLNPKNTKAWVMIGKIWYNEKDREKACESWVKAQALKSEEATTLLNTYCGK